MIGKAAVNVALVDDGVNVKSGFPSSLGAQLVGRAGARLDWALGGGMHLIRYVLLPNSQLISDLSMRR